MTQSSRHDLEAGFEQELFGERIAHLHGRALLLRILAELGRRHGGAVDAVAAGLGAEIDDRLSDPGRGGIKDLGRIGDPDRHGVDQAIAVVAAVKADRAAHRRHPEGISIAADARHHAGHQVAGPRMRRIAEAQEVEAGDRPRPHGEHVAQDAADPGGGALIGLDVARVVVALHLEHDRLTIADVDDAGVLARALDHPGRRGGQGPQMDFRGLVRAVLVPHGREDAELGEGRRAADEVEEALILLRLEAVLGNQLGGDFGFVRDHHDDLQAACLK